MLSKVIEACNYLLNNYSEAQACKEYLSKRLNESSQELFQFGYFPNVHNIEALTSLVDESILNKYSLYYTRDIEDALFPRKINFSFFEDHPLIMPYKDAYGNTIGIVGRSLLNDKDRKISKYKNTNFLKTRNLFGLYENKKSILDKGCAFIVEGQFDTIKSVEHGFSNIVSLGSAGMSDYQISLISRYTDNICLLLDNDEAGEKGRKKIIDKYSKYITIHNFYLPEPYKDIDEYLTHNSYESLSFTIKA